ncbi:MAG: hypothetical protein IKQ96_00575 [Lachnospiraceae bacterium]|nr:hypothetical protein [Lachnospiraceae bacterium]
MIDAESATVTGVKLGSGTVDSSNYTIAQDGHSVTIKKEYLATLSNGEKTFSAMAGDTACVVGTVTISGSGSASFSKAAAADVTVALADVTITGLKNGDSAVSSENYEIATGAHSITIDKDYLSTLDNGDVTFHVLYGDAGDFTFVVTVGA